MFGPVPGCAAFGTKINPASTANVLNQTSIFSRNQQPQVFLARPCNQSNRRFRTRPVLGDNVGLSQATFDGLALGVQISSERGIIKDPSNPLVFSLLQADDRYRNAFASNHQIVGHRLQGQGP